MIQDTQIEVVEGGGWLRKTNIITNVSKHDNYSDVFHIGTVYMLYV